MATSRSIELYVICSPQVKKNASMWIDAAVPWTVDATKPFSDEQNFGRLCSMLNIYSVCELCHYSEGVVGGLVDHTKTPEELGYRPRMQVYLRLKKQSGNLEAKVSTTLNLKLSPEEEIVLRRLRANAIPNLNPEDPCPLCTRTSESDNAMRAGASSANLGNFAQQSFVGSPTGLNTSTQQSSQPTQAGYRPEVGVQCGTASRINEPIVEVSFGSAARTRDISAKQFGGPPMDFPAPATMGGANYVDFDETVVDLKTELETVQRERDQLRIELRDVTKQKTELEHWKMQHRCEVSADVAKMKQQMETLQSNLRDVMRGREEVFSLLQQRRSAGTSYGSEGPYSYAPFATNLPNVDQPISDPHSLLSTDRKELRKSTISDSKHAHLLGGAGHTNDQASFASPDHSGVEVERGPSGISSTFKSAIKTEADVEQPPGQCLMQVTSLSGEPFHVKRKIDSHVRSGKNVLVLMSLDNVITDEIMVEELEQCSVAGANEMTLATTNNAWSLRINANERQRWVHWLYALNPWLSAMPNASGIPAAY